MYEAGVFRPLEPVDLPSGARVRLRVTVERLDQTDAHQSAAPTRRLTPALTLTGVALAGMAQFWFQRAGEFTWPAFSLAALATLAVGLAFARQPVWGLERRAPAEPRRLTAAFPLTAWRVGLMLAAGLMMSVVLFHLAGDRAVNPPPDLNWTLPLWGAAIGCFLAAMPASPQPTGALRRAPMVTLILAIIVMLALVLRGWRLDAIPPTLGGDEGSQGLEAIRVLEGAIRNPFSTGWLGVPTLSFYFNAPTIALLGPTVAALRLPWVLVGTATVLAAYALMARLHGHASALITAALLAGYHYHIHFSRLGSNQIADGLFATLTLLCLYRAYDRRSPFDYALCGSVIGVAQYFYAGARFTAVLAAATLLMLALRDGRRFWREQGWGVAALLGAAVLSAAPMIQYALRFPDDYNARINQVGILQSGWLAHEQIVRGQGPLPILIDQFWRAALAYNAYPDRTFWYGLPRPLFDLVYGALFILGLGFALTRLFDRRIFPLAAWWGGAIILGGMLTESPPSSQRLVTTAIPAIAFVAFGLLLLVQGLERLVINPHPHLRIAVLSLATAALIALSVRTYFIEYTPLRVYGNPNAVLATELARYANARLAPATRLVFFGWPRMSVDFGSLAYLAPHLERVDVFDPLTTPPTPDLAPPGRNTVFVFVPERIAELDLVRRSFPGGTVETVPSPVDGTPLFTVYYPPAADGAMPLRSPEAGRAAASAPYVHTETSHTLERRQGERNSLQNSEQTFPYEEEPSPNIRRTLAYDCR